ncbi:MAG: AAA family ATPase [Hahellaceae bacterium]|nr:AAA family ATPase [Hahellaceae bacterium]
MLTPVPGYRIEQIIFSGEYTQVARAVRESDQQPVVLKQLKMETEASTLSRFLFSYDVASQFDHPNITRVLAWSGVRRSDVLAPPVGEGRYASRPTIVLEDLQGVDLFAYLKTCDQGRLSLACFLNMAVQLADALSVIHYQQVIHKDLHPGNLLYTPSSGLVQITDFGLASLLSREQPLLQPPERLEGVLAYISPEQTGRMNRSLDYRSDFYTLGCTFYHLLSGHPPFQAKDALGLVHAHLAKPPVALSRIRPEIPSVLSDIVDKLLMKAAEDRYQSALGLKRDLERVRQAVLNHRPVPEMTLGQDDISDRLQIPQKLYGRESEVEALLQKFFQAAGGKPKLLAIAGYSGIGKSALVHEVHKPIAAYGGFFCAGKFDQFQKNIPYSALQTAFRGWIQHTLSWSESQRGRLKARLLNLLGTNARVLIDFMPDFEWVLGTLPPVAELGADEMQNRFHLVFQQFIQEITRDHPLVLFIDDLQWADRGTLNLLPPLLAEGGARLLVIVAYRNNEVNASHPAMRTLKRIAEDASTSRTLELGALSASDIGRLLQDSLHRPEEELQSLVTLIQTKTAGNPFFIGEFLKTLYTEKLLNFDMARQRWCWVIDEINAKGITNNVVELMLGKMAQLPPASQAMIQLGACVGSRFNLDMLALVAEKTLPEVTKALWPALREGLLLQDGGDGSLGLLSPRAGESLRGSRQTSHFSPVSAQCRFLHDRMLQAAYQSLSGPRRRATHLQIGRLLLKQFSMEALSDEQCFAIVEQLNHSIALIHDQTERLTLMKLNLRAARQARAASVWEAAVGYARQALALLPESAWEEGATDIRDIYQIKAECEYLDGHPEASEKDYEILLSRVTDDLFRAEICATRLVQSIGRADIQKGLAYGCQGLAYLGLPVPPDDQLPGALKEARARLLKSAPDGLVDAGKLPEMTDPAQRLAMRIYPNLNAVAMISRNVIFSEYCIFSGCNLILSAGKSDMAAIHLAYYATHLSRERQLSIAFAQGSIAKRIADSYTPCREIANCYTVLGGWIGYLKAPYRETIELCQKAMQWGRENGEIARAAISNCNSLFARMSMGENLRQVQEEAEFAEDFLNQKSVFHPAGWIIRVLVQALRGTKDQCDELLSDAAFEPAQLAKIKTSFHFPYLLHYRGILAFWSGHSAEALDWMRQAHAYEAVFPLTSFSSDHYFYFGLLLLQCRESWTDTDQRHFDQCVAMLHLFAETYPPNFLQKERLLHAERLRKEGGSIDQISEAYRDAIALARDHGFTQFQALACELFGRFWLEQGWDDMADPYLREALFLYRRWGCMLKVAELEKTFHALLASTESSSWLASPRAEVSKAGYGPSLDMASVMKSAQLISSELQLPQLAAKVLDVIVECAGASAAALVIMLNDRPMVVAQAGAEHPLKNNDAPQFLDTCRGIPVDLIHHVLNKHERVNIGEVANDRRFAGDPYLQQHRPHSLLCVPLHYREKYVGALYLESSLARNLFTPDRLDVIHLLLAQAAISFENARLFNEVTQLNQRLEQNVAHRTAALQQAIKDLKNTNEELNAFSYSVSHDLRAPLRSIKSFSHMLYETHAQSLGETGGDLLQRILRNGHKMQDLIDGLLELSRVQRRDLQLAEVDLSALVGELFKEMRQRFPDQPVQATAVAGCRVMADRRMLYSALENLINNAWKYSSKNPQAQVEFGVLNSTAVGVPPGKGRVPERLAPETPIYFIKDNGAGFDMKQADRLFGSFQRLHSEKQFEGTGVGLATTKRVFEKHHGAVWAYAQPGQGAIFYFVIGGLVGVG